MNPHRFRATADENTEGLLSPALSSRGGGGGEGELSMVGSEVQCANLLGEFFQVMRGTVLTLVLILCASAERAAGAEHWVGTWGCGTQLTEPRNLPPAPLARSTLRQFVHVSLGGKRLRVRFSNAFGTNPVVMDSVHVALASGAGSATDGAIDPATDKALNFSGASAATIPPGETILSDPVDYILPPLTNLAVTIYFRDISATTITGHPGSRTTCFIQPGNAVSAAHLPAAAKAPHWYTLTGLDVLADQSSASIVILGDSITDGRGSTIDGNNRWPDNLARRLSTNTATSGVAVLNMGIGGNGVFGGLGPSAQARFNRDVLDQSGVRWLIVFEGVNDIGGGVPARSLINALARFINQAHARNVRVYGATITPFGGNGYFSSGHEAARQTVNTWIRTGGKLDAVIDFDAVVRDPANQVALLPAYDTGDGLHLNPAGYQAMASSIDLALFTQ
ncbi:MAG TPA: SGNH/GDSL hydrolase family protein [Verrucomicrobiae bacterium]|nr:SGNH/GDSL hydrolase family protein [Verrucomicrobiae bacterium]